MLWAKGKVKSSCLLTTCATWPGEGSCFSTSSTTLKADCTQFLRQSTHHFQFCTSIIYHNNTSSIQIGRGAGWGMKAIYSIKMKEAGWLKKTYYVNHIHHLKECSHNILELIFPAFLYRSHKGKCSFLLPLPLYLELFINMLKRKLILTPFLYKDNKNLMYKNFW